MCTSFYNYNNYTVIIMTYNFNGPPFTRMDSGIERKFKFCANHFVAIVNNHYVSGFSVY